MKTTLRLLTVLLLTASARAQDGPTFERHIRPILKAHCFHCHGEDGEKKGDVDLRLVHLMRASGAVSQSGHDSELLKQIKSGDMPKDGKPLPDHDIALIERWLAAGAPTIRPESDTVPAHFISEEERNHWSFQAVVSPPVPDNGEKHPLDALVKQKLAGQGLDFAPEADRVTLIRRAALDLIGLPPSPEEAGQFINDPSPEAWEKALDRLLASPHYGERWGRHWLDVAGYADSNGGGKDSVREHAWHFRDYVVRALNADKPWDVFIQEQLAGDELARLHQTNAGEVLQDTAQWDRVTATGFLRMAPDATADEPPDPVVAREAVVSETIKVVSTSLLGMTVGCAQCHDHRFDPVSHTDYYRLRAVFEPFLNPSDWRAPDSRLFEAYTAQERAENEAVEQKAQAVDKRRTDLIDREYEKYLEVRMKDLPEDIKPAVRDAWHAAADKRTPEQNALLKKHECEFEKADHLRFLDNRSKEEEERSAMVKEAKAIRETKISRLLMAATEVRDLVPATHRYYRGDHRQPKEQVPPGDLVLFSDAPAIPPADPDQYSTGRRLAYAKWLTSGRHPLVARVLVNRFWSHHFGKGLVTQMGDFGMRTARPVQGDLLDWLSAQFTSGGWSLKQWHRMVMTSRTYRQASRNPAAEAKDAENIYLARMPLRRLEAEAVRDALLAVAGNLKTELGGRPLVVARRPEGGIVLGKEVTNDNNDVVKEVISLGENANRRSLYVQNRRKFPLSVLQTFDMPYMVPNCSQRAVTTVAPQSLMMLNDTFVVEQSQVMSRLLFSRHADDHPAAILALWRKALIVSPDESELTDARAFLDAEIIRQREKGATPQESTERAYAALSQVLFASNRFLYTP
jgi:cytochrome c553